VIKNQAPLNKKLSSLPVTGVTISTAVRGRSKKITQQVFIPFTIFDQNAEGIFLIVPHLATSIILGDDWLTHHDVIINYMTHQIEFPRWNKSSPFQIDSGDIPSAQITRLSVHQNIEPLVPTALEHCLLSISTHNNFSCPVMPIETEINCLNDNSYLSESITNKFYENIMNSQGVTEEQKEQLANLLQDFHDVFNDHPGRSSLYTCRFNVSEDKPFKIKPYPIPFSRRPAMSRELQRMLDWGVVERCSSPYSNPIICVGKPDGSVRLCLDARRINRIILPMRDSSQPLNELLARFGGKKIFSSLDFTAGYWQVPLHVDVRKYTAFVYEGRTYQFCVVPFGLNISNTAFGQALEAVLNVSVDCGENILTDLHIYVDDLLVSSISFNDQSFTSSSNTIL
jgi:hypothetical protein